MARHSKLLLFVGLGFTIVWHSVVASAQVKVVPGSAARGEQLLTDKGCVNCHSLNGAGGRLAPDLARTPPHAEAPESLASAMWNHATEMWIDPASGVHWNTQMTSADAADLFAYLYSVLYFSLPGDASRGKRVFEGKGCADCHKDVPTAGAAGRAMSTWATVNDPIMWAERMWNHSSEMKNAIVRKGFQWPTLSSQDVADLMIYLRSLPVLRAKSSSFRMGEPEQGRLVFERSCESCHSFGPALGKRIDLLSRQTPRTVTGYIAVMWNHTPQMRGQSTAPLPPLGPGEMPDLIAFLFSQSYFFERGDSGRGRGVFESKGCAGCHEQRRKEINAPDLTQAFEVYSPITLIAAVWRHGPNMFQTMRRDRMTWPQFHESEMADLIAYLNSRLIVRVAPKQN